MKKITRAVASRAVIKRPSVKKVAPKSVVKLVPIATSAANIGSHIGTRVGRFLGGGVQRFMDSIIGQGPYTRIGRNIKNIRSNSVLGLSTGSSSQIPMMHRDKGVTTIQHREYIADVAMTVDFACTSYDITPTNSALFPWLASLSTSFQEYKVMGIVFEFRSLAANAVSGTNAGMGSITAALAYDVYQAAPVTKSDANNSAFAVSCKPVENMMIPVECSPLETSGAPLFIRHTPTEDSDKHFYDFAKLHIVTQGASAAYGGAGELWATYDIAFFKPTIPTLPQVATFAHFTRVGAPAVAATCLPDDLIAVSNSLGATVAINRISLPAVAPRGNYVMLWSVRGTVNSAATLPPTFGCGGSNFNGRYAWNNSTSLDVYAPYPAAAALTTMFSVAGYYDGFSTSTPPYFYQTATPAAFPGGTANMDVYIFYLGAAELGSIGAHDTALELSELRMALDRLTARVRDDTHYESKETPPPALCNPPGCVCSDGDCMNTTHYVCPVHPTSQVTLHAESTHPALLSRWR